MSLSVGVVSSSNLVIIRTYHFSIVFTLINKILYLSLLFTLSNNLSITSFSTIFFTHILIYNSFTVRLATQMRKEKRRKRSVISHHLIGQNISEKKRERVVCILPIPFSFIPISSPPSTNCLPHSRLFFFFFFKKKTSQP